MNVVCHLLSVSVENWELSAPLPEFTEYMDMGSGSEPIFINSCMNVILQVHFSTTTCLRYITCSVSLLPLDCCSLACQF